MIKKRFGKKTYGCKKIKGSKAYHCSPLKPKKSKVKGTSARKIKGGRKAHKGHRTKRGLAQDQRMKSQEKHEKAYRKDKRKGKR